MNNENEISVYGNSPNAMEDFPILKAFQQYIDAEQAKARRRLISISIIFSVLTISLVAAFMYLLNNANDRIRELGLRNQALNDRLVEFAMRERDRSVDMATGNAAGETKAVTKQLSTALEAIQAQIAEQQTAIATLKTENEQRRAAEEAQQSAQKKVQEELEKARAAAKAAEVERKKADEEKERLRREEVERQRRRLYPEYYEKLDAASAPKADAKPTTPAPKAKPTAKPATLPAAKPHPVAKPAQKKPRAEELEPRLQANEDLYEALEEIDEEELEDLDEIEDEPLETKPLPPAAKPVAAKPTAKVDEDIEDLKPVSYFDAPATKPVAAKPAEKPVVKPAVKPVAKPVAKPAAKPAVKPSANLADQKLTVKPTAAKPAQKPAAKPKSDKPKTEEEMLEDDINDVLNQLNIDVDVSDADDEKPATKWRVPVK